ncbi:MAG: LuxR C-terminal-related transcriptional regulator [Anaerolineaceae bacterium]|nr:LuxR C-terminal-related transcriptional regulator [Anaerolineaceae bacterium]
MTHLLFLPDDQTFILLDSPLPPDELVSSINNRQWLPPPPIAAFINAGMSFTAVCAGKMVILLPDAQPGSPTSADDKPEQTAPGRLSGRQNQILHYLMEGLTTQQISIRTGLHPRTVQYHISFIKSFFQAGTRAESIGRALALGLFRGRASNPLIYPRRKLKPKP